MMSGFASSIEPACVVTISTEEAPTEGHLSNDADGCPLLCLLSPSAGRFKALRLRASPTIKVWICAAHSEQVLRFIYTDS